MIYGCYGLKRESCRMCILYLAFQYSDFCVWREVGEKSRATLCFLNSPFEGWDFILGLATCMVHLLRGLGGVDFYV